MGAVVTTPFAIALTIISSKSLDLEYWYKWIVSYVYIEILRRFSKKRFDLYDMFVEHDPYKVGFLPPPEEIALESPLPESKLATTTDDLFFYGVNSKSECLTVYVARGEDNVAEAFVRLRLEDGRTYELKESRGWQQSSCDKRVFSCGDLQMHHLSPMRRWRIFFNGLMREKYDDEFKASEKMVHVKFALLWRASSDVFDFTTDVNTKSLATAFANTKWNQFQPPIEKLKKAMNTYTQTGVIFGNVTIEGREDDHNLYLFGEKMRFMDDIGMTGTMESFHVLGWTSFDGKFVHIVETSIANIVEKLRFGYIVQPTGGIESITDATIPLEKPDKGQINQLKTNFHADGDSYELKGQLFGEKARFQSDYGCITIDQMNLEMNMLKGKGIIFKGMAKRPSTRSTSKKPVASFLSVVPYVVQFSDVICQDSEVTGGKGSSLGKLTEISKELKTFVVTEGIVVTTSAYEKFLPKEVIQDIQNLEKCLYSNNKSDDIIFASQNVFDKIVESAMPEEVHQEIVSHLQKTFLGRYNTLKFAVRSSGTGEDTEQMSAAGQMDTFLGVTGIKEIISAVKKCWASQFGHCAVQYKRQNGQVLNSPMAVVVQQMVSCDVAGVLFTCDPLTGDPTRISITANYGLGESVVSGLEEPDTIELKRNKDGKLAVKNKVIGSKSRRIVVKENEEGTNLEEVPEHERSNCCLSDENAIRLGDLAVKFQIRSRSHRDVEWGYWKNNLYIFQSRPVTSGTGATDFEIDHEMDAPLRVENDYFTVSNVGEVMPGAMTPLGSEVLLKYLYVLFQRPNYVDFQEDKRTKYFPHGMISMYNHTMFSCPHIFRKIDNQASSEANSIAVFGRVIENDELYEMTKARYSCSKKSRIFQIKEAVTKLCNMFFMAERRLKKSQITYENFQIPVDNYKTAQEMFDALMYSCTDLVESFGTHIWCSEASAIWNIIIFSILRSARGEVDSDVYTDFAKLLTTCSEVESADVPPALEEISTYISKDINPEDFKKMKAEEAISWLQSTTSEAGLKYREFLLKHGHRCLREFDIHSKTWLTDPSSLIQLLQNTVGSQKKDRIENEKVDNKTLILNLKTPLSSSMRFLMRILIPLSRQSVQNRECSKSVTIRGLNEWRKGYSRLSQLMASEGRIPDEDLLFFMTVEEIKELLATRSPRIISRANHRRRRHPILDKYMFPEISKGVPIPINLETQPIPTSDDCLSMKGIPVSQGIAKGFIRVAVTLEEASLLQSGEILVTYSTDIGWSPYFPILSGVVTELGGLISHGAVVSREYGLPCIAGLHGATRQFQTGDYALLDGNKGILHKLPPPENLEFE